MTTTDQNRDEENRMTTETETTTTETQKTTWADAATASAEAQKPAAPKPKPFVERLPCQLTGAERVAVAIKFANQRRLIEDFDAKTKEIMAERKAEKAKLEASSREYEDATRTGTVYRDVNCVEHVSFEQNRKWRVRTDTGETISEQALSGAERQAELPLDEDDDDGQLSLGDVTAEASVDANDADEPAEGDAIHVDSDGDLEDGDADDTSNVTDPDALLAAAQMDPTAPPPEEPKRSRNRRGA